MSFNLHHITSEYVFVFKIFRLLEAKHKWLATALL